jgi:hypothetical protein
VSPEYYLEIEAHFTHRRGTPFVLSAKDVHLMREWAEAGIPLSVVLEAIDSVFDKATERSKSVNSLHYCRHAVKELWANRRELHVGSGEVVPEEDVSALLEALAVRLESSPAAPFADRVRALAAEKTVPRIEERLMELEDELVDAVLATATDGEALRAEAERAVGTTDEKSRDRARVAHLRRIVRERFELPRLSLF